MRSWRRKIFFAAGATATFLLSSCSPIYVVQAGWEEARILWKRQPIDEVVEDPATTPDIKKKLLLVQDARKFAASFGLKPKGSFTKFSQIDRDVLVWVLTGSSKIALQPVTWWFPIVGSVPYKGFFEREDAEAAAKALEKKELDVYLRPSAAFSTLGWFDDPLLSTTIRFDEISLANTVIHEILHNTIWVPDYVPFNESLANYVGTIGAIKFFQAREGDDGPNALEAVKRWHTEIDFAKFIANTTAELQQIYTPVQAEPPSPGEPAFEEIVKRRDAVLDRALEVWIQAHEPGSRRNSKLNNAVILSHQAYLDRLWLFDEAYSYCDSLPLFIEAMQRVEKRAKEGNTDPYTELEAEIVSLKKLRELANKPFSQG